MFGVVLVLAASGMVAHVARADDRSAHATVSAEVSAAGVTNHPTYNLGAGTTVGLGVSYHDRLSFEWAMGSYAMPAKGDLEAVNTLGKLKTSAVLLRLRLPLLPVSVGGGLGQIKAPMLVRDDDGTVGTSSVRQVGVFATGALILVRSSKLSIYAEARLFVPLFKEIPPVYYPDQSGDQAYPATESHAYPLATLGLGVRVTL